MPERFDPRSLAEEDPFEIDTQVAHLFKHARLGVQDVYDVWAHDPVFYPARPPADWVMIAEVAGAVIAVPLAKSRSGDPAKCRPIGCYFASLWLADRFRRDRYGH